MRRKHLKTTCLPRRKKRMFSGVFLLFALRKRVAISSGCRSIIVQKIVFFFPYIHRCFTPLTIWISINMFIVRICFGKALFSLMKKKQNKENSHTVSPEYAGLHQTNYGVQTIKCSCLFKVSFTIKRKKSCQTNNQQLYSRFFVRKI